MEVYAISDLHLSINNPKPMNIFGPVWDNYLDDLRNDWNSKVGEDDVVILAGDLSWAMKLDEAKPDLDFLSTLSGKKILIRGNHDYWWSAIGKVRDILPKDVYALQNDSIKIGGVIFCGSRGWTFDDSKLVDRELIRLQMSLDSAMKLKTGDEKIVCIMHYPPFEKGKDSPFVRLIEEYPVSAVVYGHIHGASLRDYPLVQNFGGIPYFLTSCDMARNTLQKIL